MRATPRLRASVLLSHMIFRQPRSFAGLSDRQEVENGSTQEKNFASEARSAPCPLEAQRTQRQRVPKLRRSRASAPRLWFLRPLRWKAGSSSKRGIRGRQKPLPTTTHHRPVPLDCRAFGVSPRIYSSAESITLRNLQSTELEFQKALIFRSPRERDRGWRDCRQDLPQQVIETPSALDSPWNAPKRKDVPCLPPMRRILGL